MIQTDLLIIGAGPVGLFTVFEAGLLKLHCHLIDALPQPGGQLSEIYPKKPIYDIPGFPDILAGDLVDNLMRQIEPFHPGFTLGERADSILEAQDGSFIVTTNEGTEHKAKAVIIAGGLGSFEPRKPPIPDLPKFENKGINFLVKNPIDFENQKIVISGGGDSALDWVIYFAENDIPEQLTLVHRRKGFRGHPDSAQRVIQLAEQGKINLVTEAEVIDVKGNGKLSELVIQQGKEQKSIPTDTWLPLFGLKPSLGPIADWGLALEKSAILVDTYDYRTNRDGIFAVGDVNTYPGKLKLILCGFHEATLAVQSVFKRIYPDKNNVLKYTTVNGIQGF